MTSGLLNLENILVGLMLAGAVVSDLKIKKVRNTWILAMFFVSIAAMLFLQGLSSYGAVLSSIATAIILGLPLYLLKIFAGGDFKLLIAVSPLLSWKAMALIIISSFIWGAFLGLFRAILAGELKLLLFNTFAVFSSNKPKSQQLHMIPFTVAIFFGFLSYLTLTRLNTWEIL